MSAAFQERLADLEAQVARLCADLDATCCLLDLAWHDGHATGRQSVSVHEATARATAPRSRGHLSVVRSLP